jgi:hypothetical protein
VDAAWNLRRVRRMETELCPETLSYHDLLEDDKLQKQLDLLARHNSNLGNLPPPASTHMFPH